MFPRLSRGGDIDHRLLRALCWTVIGVIILLMLRSAYFPAKADEHVQHQSPGADAQLRIALGLYRLGATEPIALARAQEALGKPATDHPLALSQALVAEVILGPEAARDYLPTDPVLAEVTTWVEQRWDDPAQVSAVSAPPELAQHAGRFARLLGPPDARQRLLDGSAAFMAGISLLTMGGLLALAIGVVLLVIALRRLASGRITAVAIVSPHPSAYLVGFTLYLILYLTYASTVPHLLPEGWQIFAIWGFLPIVAVPLWYLRHQGLGALAASLGWQRGRGWLREMGSGLVGYLAGLPIVVVGVLATAWLAQFMHTSHPVAEMINADTPLSVYLGLFALAAGFAPVVEELFFRGFLVAHLLPRWGMPLTLLGSGVVFAAVHPQGLAGIPALAAIGIVFAGIRCWRGSLIASGTAHALHNGSLLLLMLLLT